MFFKEIIKICLFLVFIMPIAGFSGSGDESSEAPEKQPKKPKLFRDTRRLEDLHASILPKEMEELRELYLKGIKEKREKEAAELRRFKGEAKLLAMLNKLKSLEVALTEIKNTYLSKTEEDSETSEIEKDLELVSIFISRIEGNEAELEKKEEKAIWSTLRGLEDRIEKLKKKQKKALREKEAAKFRKFKGEAKLLAMLKKKEKLEGALTKIKNNSPIGVEEDSETSEIEEDLEVINKIIAKIEGNEGELEKEDEKEIWHFLYNLEDYIEKLEEKQKEALRAKEALEGEIETLESELSKVESSPEIEKEISALELDLTDIKSVVEFLAKRGELSPLNERKINREIRKKRTQIKNLEEVKTLRKEEETAIRYVLKQRPGKTISRMDLALARNNSKAVRNLIKSGVKPKYLKAFLSSQHKGQIRETFNKALLMLACEEEI